MLPLLLLLSINFVIALKPNRQCLRYRQNDIFLSTCPAYSKVDFSAALFPDPAVLSSLSNPTLIVTESTSATTESIVDVAESITATYATKQADKNKSTFPRNTGYEGKRKPLASFEEWQKKVIQDNDKDRRHMRKTTSEETSEENEVISNKRQQQVVDSIDGGFSDDFGSMFEDLIGTKKEKTPNVYQEGEYIAPSKAGQQQKEQSDKKMQQFARMKSLKERFNYASIDCAATVRKANKQAKGAQSILYESKDQYLLNKCAADKFVIINLCEQIRVDTIVMANFEFFSSTFKDFRVYSSAIYPTNDWKLLGQWQARNTRDLQVFKVPDSGFLEYIKIEMLTHYGHEYYCPLSLVRVHGMSMMEYYTTVESQDDDPVIEEEHLWPAEVREQLIQPQYDVTNTSESFPIKNDQDEEDIKQIIPPIQIVENSSVPIIDFSDTDIETVETASIMESETAADAIISTASTSTSTTNFAIITSQESDHSSLSVISETDTTEITLTTTTATELTSDESIPSLEVLNSTASEEVRLPQQQQQPQKLAPNNYQKEGNTQESIYKTIMKRLNVLESNMTLSLRYLDEQNRNLNDVLKDMEKKHQEQLIQLIGHLNETASYRIDSMKRRYEQWYEDLKDQTDSDMREMTAKVSILAEQLSFERRVSVSQLVIMITLFVFMALSRGTFSTLSPVMAAQQEERKRRESIDQSSTLSNETKDILNNKIAANTTTQKFADNDSPKKPNNLRRHSDIDGHYPQAPASTRSRNPSDATKNDTHFNSLGMVELQNEVLQKKLSDVFIHQQQKEQEQEVPLLTNTSGKSSLENIQSNGCNNSLKNRTSPPLIK